MSAYVAPLKDMRFLLHELAGLDAVGQLPGCEEATPETVGAILDEPLVLGEPRGPDRSGAVRLLDRPAPVGNGMRWIRHETVRRRRGDFARARPTQSAVA